MQEISRKLDELANMEVTRKKFLGFGLFVAAAALFSGLWGRSKQDKAVNLPAGREKRLAEIYKTITAVNK